MSGAFGITIKRKDLDVAFLTGPGEFLIDKTLIQMSLAQANPNPTTNATVYPFQTIFGPYIPEGPNLDQQRWAGYERFDWSVRQLPTMNVFLGDVEDKDSDQAFLRGTVKIQVFWPPNQRRNDLMRVQTAFKGVLQNFFASDYVKQMLDELYYIQRPAKVYGLNEYGKNMVWTPNMEGLVEDQLVPVTSMDVKYRIDLRAWYRALHYMDRTKAQPFQTPLADLTVIGGEYAGVTDTLGQDVAVTVQDEFTVTNP